MEFLQTFFLAALIAFVGFLPPGMLNMTAVKMRLEHHAREAYLFLLGAITIILVQAFIAVTGTKFLSRHPEIIDYLTYVAIAVFLALAVFFFRQARRQLRLQVQEPKRNSYRAGLLMASMNALAIPFFLGYSTVLQNEGRLPMEMPHPLLFALGAAAGAGLLFALYVAFAAVIQRRVQFIARNINYILSALLLVLAVVTVVRVMAGMDG